MEVKSVAPGHPSQAEAKKQLEVLYREIMELEHNRIALEKELCVNGEGDVFDISRNIEILFQEQKKVLINMYKLMEASSDDAGVYKAIWEWRKFNDKHRYLPPSKAHTINGVEYVSTPEGTPQYFELFFNQLSAYYPIPSPIVAFIGYGEECMSESTKDSSRLIASSAHDLSPIIGLVDWQENPKKFYPFLWSIDTHNITMFNEIQVKHFLIPELRRLRNQTNSIYIKQLINYHCVLFRKVEMPANLYFVNR